MNSQALGLRVASTVLALIGLAQLTRLATRSEIRVAGHQIPQWPSALATIVTGGLSAWLCKLSRTATR